MFNRRDFLQMSAAVGAAAVMPYKWVTRTARLFAQSTGLRKFIQALPGLGPTGIPVATARPDRFFRNTDSYELLIGEYEQQLHPDLPKATKLWGYADATTGVHRHLGPVIVAQRGRPVHLRFTNALGGKTHPLPVDTTIPGAELAQNRTAVHLHGGHVPWVSDGGPFAWFGPDGAHGASFLSNPLGLPRGQAPLPGQADYFYPNDQSARLMWYHDHALGITRLNAYAGIAGGYVVTDSVEANLTGTGNVIPTRQLPLIFQDKIFVTDSTAFTDPTWDLALRPPGDLWYAHVYERNRWTIGGSAKVLPNPSAIPEFFGDTMLVNGLVYPSVTVEPTRYRLRILNACNARFVNPRLVRAQANAPAFPASTEPALGPMGQPIVGPAFVQIGTEGGFLQGPAFLDGRTPATTLLLGPAERADLIVDFSDALPGTTFLLYSDAPAPFPVGDPRNDYFPGAPKNPTVSTPGFGPNTRTLMQFVVGKLVGAPDPMPNTIVLPGFDPAPLATPGSTALPANVPVRQLTLNEDFDEFGRLIQRLGTNVSLSKGTFARNYMDAATETPSPGSVEVWQIVNRTGDTHPIHFHLVNVQLISRQPFQVNSYNGTPSFTGPARPADPNELGWKETVRMNPAEVTTVIMKFDFATVPFTVPLSPRTGGHEYVWHCHILEHEEHDMMRPLVVGAGTPVAAG